MFEELYFIIIERTHFYYINHILEKNNQNLHKFS